MNSRLTLLAMALMSLIAWQAAQADLLVYEGFDYNSGSHLNTQNGGGGWAGAWSMTGSTSGDTGMVSGWNMTGMTSTGRAWRMDNFASGSLTRTMSQAVGIVGGVATHSVIWTSVMLTHAKDSFNYSYNLLDSSGTSRIRIQGPIDNGAAINRAKITVQADAYYSDLSAIDPAAFSYTPKLALMRIGFAAGGLTTVETWLFGSSDSVPQTEAALGAGPTDYHKWTGVADFSFDRLTFGGYSFEPSQIDEIRVATTLDDALHGTQVIPEPASMAMLAAGGLMMIRRRK
jgi:hypothetical protein